MSDRQISARIAQIDAELSPLGETMERLGSASSLYLQGAPWATKADHEQYVSARDRYQSLKSERDGLVMEQSRRNVIAARENPPKRTKTFVNSFGEATSRYVTSAAYERAMKRNEKEIQSRMKGFR